MKKNIVLTLMFSAALLTGCNKETELIDKLETSGNTESAQTMQNVQTDSKITETSGDVKYILGGETEATEYYDAENEDNADIPTNMRLLDIAKLNAENENEDVSVNVKSSFLNGKILCAFCNIKNENGHVRDIMRFYNIDDETAEKTILLPDSYNFEEFIGCGGDILCSAKLTHYITRNNVAFEESSVITVKNDYSYELLEYNAQNSALPRCGHNIAEWERDIVDADSGGVLVEGYYGANDYDLYATSQSFCFPIDENRFVYMTLGYERLPGFGIYDFADGRATDVPDSEDLIPLGVHGGKIYSLKTTWDGFGYGEGFYITDTETLETDFFTDFPTAPELNDYFDYVMTESGSYIVLAKSSSDADTTVMIYGIDTDTKEISSAEIPNDFEYRYLTCSEENTVMLLSYYDKPLIIDIGS